MVVWLIGAAAIGGLIHDSRHLEIHSQVLKYLIILQEEMPKF